MTIQVAAPLSGAPSPALPIDFSAVKARQRTAWASGDYGVIGVTLQIVGESLAEAMDIRAGSRVLDVAAGNGNATLAAARRFAEVTSTDYVAPLLEQGRRRAAAERLPVAFMEADAEDLPFPAGHFDAVMSTFGVMFAPNQEQAASELLRVIRPGGKVGLASWTPDGFVGRLFKIIGKYVPPAPGLKPPSLWGDRERLDALFGASASALAAERRTYVFRYRSPAHWIEVFRTFYGPVERAFAMLDAGPRQALTADLHALIDDCNVAGDGTMVVPGTYLEAVVTKAE
ncbi:MAG: class I SAM-dependent methyltransferase [Bauldia sp.]